MKTKDELIFIMSLKIDKKKFIICRFRPNSTTITYCIDWT